MSPNALGTALTLIHQRLACFPCRDNKRPATPHGFKDATLDPNELRELWQRHPGPLVGVSTGSVSGIDVLDLDSKHREANEWWADNRHHLPATRTHRTRAGGLHLIFRHAPGQRCTAGKIALGVDIRGEGGYVIWWPGVGLPVLSDSPPAAWPQWFLSKLGSSPAPPGPRILVPDSHGLVGLIRLVANAHEGARNRLTFWAACRAGEMVRSGLLKADAAAAILTEAAVRAGLPRMEAARTAMSGLKAGGGR